MKQVFTLLFSIITTVGISQSTIGVQEFKLDNGLTVMLSENHEAPRIFGMVIVRAGGKHDPKEATGIAHYLEHMLFKGTTEMGTMDFEQEKIYLDSISLQYQLLGKSMDKDQRKEIQHKINELSLKAAEYAIPNEMDKMLNEIGSTDVNAYTTEDATAFHNSFPANQLEKWLDIYAHRFQNPVFRLFQSELEIVYEEKNRAFDNPMWALINTFHKNFYKVHPYGQQEIIGETEHLKNPDLEKMYEYFNTYYVANNMALLLSGDFNSKEIIPLIKEKFSNWKTGDIPNFPEYKEQPFKGNEVIRKREFPLKIGMIGYRAPVYTHSDYFPMEVCNQVLSNFEESGKIDELNLTGQLLGAYLTSSTYTDHGANMLIFVPKVMGQTLKRAERIVLEKIEEVKKGDFSEELLEAIKDNMIISFQSEWESNYGRVNQMASCFSLGIGWDKFIKYEQEVSNVTKEDVVNVAKNYLGDSKLTFYSRIGVSKKDKLKSPEYDAPKPNDSLASSYYSKWKLLQEDELDSKFVDFEKDMIVETLSDRITLRKVENPFNDLFEMEIKFGKGSDQDQYLEFLATYLNLIGSTESTASEIIKKLYLLGCSYNFYCNDDEFVLHFEGIEKNLGPALNVLNHLLHNVKPDDSKIKIIVDELKAEKKYSLRDSEVISDALDEYVIYSNKSLYLDRPSIKDVNSITALKFRELLRDVMGYEVTIDYVGRQSVENVRELISKNLDIGNDLYPKSKMVYRTRNTSDKTKIYFVKDKKSRQSQVYFYQEGKPYSVDDYAVIEGFNNYFGAGMSGIVFQEIRELRSLAYSTYAVYDVGDQPGLNNLFRAYIGCQGDKTVEAILAMLDLINNMPEKEKRMEGIRKSLIYDAKSSWPGFRSLHGAIDVWREMGFAIDPDEASLEKYEALEFSDIMTWYLQELKGKPLIITIVGNPKKMDMDDLSKIGEVKVLKKKELFKF